MSKFINDVDDNEYYDNSMMIIMMMVMMMMKQLKLEYIMVQQVSYSNTRGKLSKSKHFSYSKKQRIADCVC